MKSSEAARIVKLEDGQIVERGTHDELLEQGWSRR